MSLSGRTEEPWGSRPSLHLGLATKVCRSCSAPEGRWEAPSPVVPTAGPALMPTQGLSGEAALPPSLGVSDVLCREAEPRWFRAQLEPVPGRTAAPQGGLLMSAPGGPAVDVAPKPGVSTSSLAAGPWAGATGRCVHVQAAAAWLPGRWPGPDPHYRCIRVIWFSAKSEIRCPSQNWPEPLIHT